MAASETQRQTAAWALAEGHSPSYVAEEVGVTRQTIQNWLNQEDFTQQIEDRRAQILSAGERARIQVLMNADAITQNAINLARDPNSRNHADMVKYLMDKYLPTKQIQETHSHHEVDVTFWRAVDERLDRYEKAVQGSGRPEPKLLRGPEAVETYGVSLSADTKPASGSNGSSPEPPATEPSPPEASGGERPTDSDR